MSTEGYRVRRAALRIAAACVVLLAGWSPAALAQRPSGPPTDDQVRQQIIQQSIASYLATGHPCACPYNRDRAGHA